MGETRARGPGISYWAICTLLLLWALGGASIYVAYFIETPDQFASTAETAQNRDAYADYVKDIPAWAIGAGILAALTRLSAAVALLLRRAWALPLFVVSLLFFLVVLYRAFVLADAGDVMNPAHIGIEVAFVALTVFGIWFAYTNRAAGMLR